MSLEDGKTLYFTLDNLSSNPLTELDIYGTKTHAGCFSAPVTAIITVTDSLSEKQVSRFAACLMSTCGPLVHMKELIYNIQVEQLPAFFSLITANIPSCVVSQDVNIVVNNNSIHAHVAARRIADTMAQSLFMKVNADFDRRALKPYRDQLLITTVLEIRPPKSPRAFSARLPKFKLDMENALKAFFPKVKSVILSLHSSSYTQYVLQNLLRLEVLELVHSETASSNIQDLQSSIIHSLPYLVNLRELTVSGKMISRQLFSALGNLKNLRRLTVTGIMPSWGRFRQDISRDHQFIALETFELNCYLDDLLALRYLMKPVHALRSLLIKIPFLLSSMDQNCWPNISQVFPNVESLSFLIKGLNPSETREWFTLENVSYLRKIKQLAIQHPRPLEISDNIVERMFMTWPRLIRLSLNPKPLYLPWRLADGRSTVLPTWNVIEHIMRNKPPLRSFSAYLGSVSTISDSFYGTTNNESNEILERLTIGSRNALPVQTLEVLQSMFKKANIINAAPADNACPT